MNTHFVKAIFCVFLLAISSLLLGQNANSNTKSLLRSTPEAEKVSQQGIVDYLKAAKESGQELHSLMIVRNGKVVSEQWFGDHAADKLHQMWSVSKTFTATAVGFAVSENRLKVTDKVISFFPDKLPAEISPALRDLEVRHLLTISVGHGSGQSGQGRGAPDVDIVQSFLALPFEHHVAQTMVFVPTEPTDNLSSSFPIKKP